MSDVIPGPRRELLEALGELSTQSELDQNVSNRVAGRTATLTFSTDRACEISIRVKPLDDGSGESPGVQESVVSNWIKSAGNAAVKVARAGAASLASGAAGAVSQKRPGPVVAVALREGDVLLYCGRGIISRGIRLFTDSEFSHAALFLGGDMIGEAIGKGLVKRTRQESFSGSDYVFARRLGRTDDLAPVMERAESYLEQGLKYGYPDIVLLAALLIIKRVRPSNVLGLLIQRAAAAAAGALNKLLEGNRSLMICSEFVYRSYDEARSATPHLYSLEVPGIAVRESVSPSGLPAGVEPGSALDSLFANPELQRKAFRAAGRGAGLENVANEAATERDVEQLLRQYLDEGPPRPIDQYERIARETEPEPFLVDVPTATAISRFAMTLQSLHERSIGSTTEDGMGATLEGVPSAMSAALERLLRIPADFVTPADLQRSTSLADLGYIFRA